MSLTNSRVSRRWAVVATSAVFIAAVLFRLPTHVKAAYDSTASMALPFQSGATVYFNGPHNWAATFSQPWNSLDFEPSPANTYDPVYAPTAGKVHLNECGGGDYIRIDPSGNNTGWQTTFIHLSEIDVSDGATVNRGDKIGMTGNPSGGCGYGNVIHTHFSIWYVAVGHTWSLGMPSEEVDWGGVNRGGADVGNQPVIGDWVWTDGADQYLGTASNIETGATATCNNSNGCIATVSIYDDGDVAGWHALPEPALSYLANQLYVFVHWADNALRYIVYTDGTWSSWQSLGGTIVGNPSAVAFNGRMNVFVRGTDGGVWTRSGTLGGSWSTWATLGTGFDSDPSATALGTTQLQVVAHLTNGHVYYRYALPGNPLSWGDQSDLGSPTSGASGTPSSWVYSATGVTQIQIFTRSIDGSAWWRIFTVGGTWTSWATINGNLIGDPVVIQYSNQVELVGEQSDQSVGIDAYIPGAGWTGWAPLSGISINGNPTEAQIGNELVVGARGTDNGMYWRDYVPGAGWSGWSSLAGGVTSPPLFSPMVGDGIGDFLIHGVVRWADNSVQVTCWSGSGPWCSWSSLGGSPA